MQTGKGISKQFGIAANSDEGSGERCSRLFSWVSRFFWQDIVNAISIQKGG